MSKKIYVKHSVADLEKSNNAQIIPKTRSNEIEGNFLLIIEDSFSVTLHQIRIISSHRSIIRN